MIVEAVDLELLMGERILCKPASFSIAAGELWAVLGRNGVGKTTLLRTLAGLRSIARGQVKIGGTEISRWPARDLARTRAFVAQQARDALGATVLEVVLGAGYARQGEQRSGAWFDGPDERERAHAALTEFDLASFETRDIRSLSGGERQRVALAAALMQDSELLLLDEPLAHLDIDMQIGVLNRLSRRLAARGRLAAIVMSLHDINVAARFASHIALFDGAGGLVCGARDVVLNEASLSAAFHHPVTALSDHERTWYVAQ